MSYMWFRYQFWGQIESLTYKTCRCGIASRWIDVDQIAVAVPHPTRSSDGISRFTRHVSHGFLKDSKDLESVYI